MNHSPSKRNQSVTAIISHSVKPKYRQAYEDWINLISEAAARFEGHRSVNIIRPEEQGEAEYVVILTFDSYSNLKQWMDSDTRQHWLEKAKLLIQKPENVDIQTGLESWFTRSGSKPQKSPVRYKQTILTWVCVYILLLILNTLIAPILQGLPGFIRTAIISAITVILLAYLVMPRATKLFYKWLYPKSR